MYCKLCEANILNLDLFENLFLMVPYKKDIEQVFHFCDNCIEFAQNNLHVTSKLIFFSPFSNQLSKVVF